MVCFVVTQHNESELSLCLRYSKTSCEATQNKILTKNFFCVIRSVDYFLTMMRKVVP